MKIEIINKSNHNLPHYETTSSAGMDLKAFIDEPVLLNSLERKIIKTGAIPTRDAAIISFHLTVV